MSIEKCKRVMFLMENHTDFAVNAKSCVNSNGKLHLYENRPDQYISWQACFSESF